MVTSLINRTRQVKELSTKGGIHTEYSSNVVSGRAIFNTPLPRFVLAKVVDCHGDLGPSLLWPCHPWKWVRYRSLRFLCISTPCGGPCHPWKWGRCHLRRCSIPLRGVALSPPLDVLGSRLLEKKNSEKSVVTMGSGPLAVVGSVLSEVARVWRLAAAEST